MPAIALNGDGDRGARGLDRGGEAPGGSDATDEVRDGVSTVACGFGNWTGSPCVETTSHLSSSTDDLCTVVWGVL